MSNDNAEIAEAPGADREQYKIPMSHYYAFDAEGGRIGICVCKLCGCALLLGDKDCDSPEIHRRWHRERGDA